MNLKGYGTFKISYDLKMLGVDEDIFKKYLYSEEFVNEEEKATSLLLKRLKGISIENIDYKEKQKLYAYLARRGFSYDSINKAFNNLLKEF